MDCAIVFTVLLSLHIGCHGSYQPPLGLYTPPPPPIPEICSINVKQIITTIPVTQTNQLTPITETRIPPGVTSYMDMPPITDTFTVIEWTSLPPSIIHVPLPPVTSTTSLPCSTIVNTIACTTTETLEPITETSTRKVIKHVPGMPITSTVFLTSTVTQPMAFKTIYLGDVTTTKTFPPHASYETTTLISTVIQSPQTTTVTSKWVMTNTPVPVIKRHPPVVVHPSPYEQTITITIPSTILIPHSTTTITSTSTSTICTTTYTYAVPRNPLIPGLDLPNDKPPAPFTYGTTTTHSTHYGINERDGITEQPYDYYDYEYEHTRPSF